MIAESDKLRNYIRRNKKEVSRTFFFFLLICAYTVSVTSHALALLYVSLFTAIFIVLLYYHKLNLPIVRAMIFAFFYIWVGFDGKCYIFEDISGYVRYFYCLITMLISAHLYRNWRRDIRYENTRHFLATVIVEFVFWGFAILYKIEIGTPPILETVVLAVIFFKWSEELINASLYLLEVIAAKVKTTNVVRQDYRRVWLTVFLILVIGGGLFSILFYPGVITADTIGIYKAAMNLGDKATRTDIHSFAYTCFERLVFSICNSFYFLTWILMTAFSAAWASFMTNICRLGLNCRIVYAVTFAWLLVPCNLYMLIATWKDIPLTIFLVVVTNMLMKISMHGGMFRVRKRDYAVLAVGIVGAALSRSNGQFVLVALAAGSMIWAIKYKERTTVQIFKSVAVAGIVVLLVKIPIYQVLQVKGTPPGFAAIPFVDGIWENVVYGKEIPQEVVSVVEEEIMPIDEFRESYEENCTNTYCFPNGTNTIKFGKVKETWIKCLRVNPFITLMARLKRSYNLWSVFPRGKIPIDTNYVIKIVDGKNLNYLDIPFFEKLRHIFRICYSDGWLYGSFCYIIARGGWNIFLWIILGLFLDKKGMRTPKIVITPAVANTMALILACCYQDYRYMYPMFVLTVLYALYVLQACAIQEKGESSVVLS